MTKNRLVLIKLGGSLITDKSTPFAVDKMQLQQIAREISQITRLYPELKIIIGNGGGSFGHYTAHQYEVTKVDKTGNVYGVCVVQDSVRQLNAMLVQSLLQENINAFAINPSSAIICNDSKPAEAFLEPLEGLLAHDVIPVIYGDIVYDRTKTATILSTEQLFSILIEKLRGKFDHISVIYAGKTEGVLNDRKQTIEEIHAKDSAIVSKQLFTLEGFDVTGGMAAKLEEAFKIITKVDQVYLIGGKEGNLLKAVTSKKTGTLIKR